jgi:hypothetical protein
VLGEEELLTRIGDGMLTCVRLVHEANLAVLGTLSDSLPTPPVVDVLPVVPRLLDHSFRFATRLLELQRHYTLEYLAVLGAPDVRDQPGTEATSSR